MRMVERPGERNDRAWLAVLIIIVAGLALAFLNDILRLVTGGSP